MAITLLDFTGGDTDYVSRHNSNNTTIENAVAALESTLSGAASTNSSTGPMIRRLFGTVTARLGQSSCTASISGQTVIVTSGWLNRAGSAVIEKAASQTVDFTGLADGTYYISVDAVGTLSASVSSGSYDLYSVAKSSTTLSSLTAIAPVVYPNPAPYDVSMYVPGLYTASQLLLRHVFARAVTFLAGLSGSYASGTTTATATATFPIKKNGSSVGSFAFAGGASTATFTFISATSFAAGDILTIEAPSSADATLGNVSATLVGARG